MADVAELRLVGLRLHLVAETKQSSAVVWASFVEEMSTNSELIAKLLSEHVATPSGMCSVCTRGGRGTPYLRWPCSVWRMAQAARSVRRRLNGGASTNGRQPTP
jgi:hypothetical protein